MASYSRTILIGNLGRDAELRATGSGAQVVNFSIATTETWRDRATGEKKELTEWHRVVYWGDSAGKIAPYLTKGKQVVVEGRNQTRSYDKDGQKHYATEIKADRVVLLGAKPESGERGPGDESFDENPDIPF